LFSHRRRDRFFLTGNGSLFRTLLLLKNTTMHLLKFTLKSLSAALVLASASSQAAVVLNPSFEADTLTPGGFSGSISNWTVSGGPGGTQRFSTQTALPTDGVNHAYANSGTTLSQLTSETIVGGQTYTLTVDVGRESTFVGSLATLRLYGLTSGPGVAIAELTGLAPGLTYLTNQTVTYTAPVGGAFDGQVVGIALIGSGGVQVIFDNVRFVPEPSSFLLGGLGALALLRRRRI
jgi:PEP-CTERM motif